MQSLKSLFYQNGDANRSLSTSFDISKSIVSQIIIVIVMHKFMKIH